MMKKINLIAILFLLVMLSACQNQGNVPHYKPNVPDYLFEPFGQTTLAVSKIESGSALLTFNELEKVTHYKVEVSKNSDFSLNSTITINALNKEYRLYFDDNSKLYVKATAVALNGKTYQTSSVQTIEGRYAVYHVGDEFNLGTTQGWQVSHGKISSDFHSMIVQPIDNETIELEKTFLVDPTKAAYFQARFITKNTNSILSVTLEYNQTIYPVELEIEQIERGYIRFDLTKLNMAVASNITVQIKSEGKNRGFQLDYVKFIDEIDHNPILVMHKMAMSNLYSIIAKDDHKLSIQNDPEPTSVTTPSTEVDFDPQKLSILEVILSGYLPRDTFKLSISNSQNEALFESDVVYIQNVNGKFTYNLLDFGIIDKDVYTINYILSADRVSIQSMQLVGESELSFNVVRGNWEDGVSAYIDQNDAIRLKSTTIYNYGDVKKQVTVDLGATPIVFFDVVSVTGAWAAKVVPNGASSDIYVVRDNSKTGKVAYDLSQILQSQGITTFTFEIFIIGGSKADQTAELKMNPISFGNALNIYSNTSSEVISQLKYNVGAINLDDFGYVYIDVQHISLGATWKLYVIDNTNNRRYEMKTSLERKYPQRYFRGKEGRYIYDIKQIIELSGNQNLSIMVEVIGNNSNAVINDIVFTSNQNIPSRNNSAY